MIKETITYEDLNGVERTEPFYFNLSKPEIVKMRDSVKGGYDVQLQSLAADGTNGALIMKFFEDFIKSAYGEKSDDGRRFMKSDELSRAFMDPEYAHKIIIYTAEKIAAISAGVGRCASFSFVPYSSSSSFLSLV